MTVLAPHIAMLGETVRDRVTGFEGPLTTVSFDLYGCIQAAVCPRIDKDGKIPDGKWLDIHRVTSVEGKRVLALPIFASATEVLDLLGRTVRDRVSGFEGTVSSVQFTLNGHIQATVCPRVDKDGKLPASELLTTHRLEVIGTDRSMPMPNFAAVPAFGATPQTHQHGPAEKSPVDRAVDAAVR